MAQTCSFSAYFALDEIMYIRFDKDCLTGQTDLYKLMNVIVFVLVVITQRYMVSEDVMRLVYSFD